MRTLWEAFDVPRPTHAHIHSLSSSHGQTHTYPCVLARRLMDAQPLISRRAPARTQTSPDPLALRLVSRYMWLRGSPKPNRHSLAACNGSIKMVLRKPLTKSAFSGGWKWDRRIFSEEVPRGIAISPVAKEILRLLRKTTGEFFWRKYGPESRILRSLPIWRL